VTFIALAEAHVLDALREAGVRPQKKIRPALDRLKKLFGREYVLAAKEFATDGIDVLWDFSRTDSGRELIAGDTDQGVIREIVQDRMSYITWDDSGYPVELELRHWLPSKVKVDPHRAFGQPTFEGSRVRIVDVAGMMKAGESAETVAEEFGISLTDARTAARILLGRAAQRYLRELDAHSLTARTDAAVALVGVDESSAAAVAAGHRLLAADDTEW
jgi:uncharacterized protein (DUF433 family)